MAAILCPSLLTLLDRRQTLRAGKLLLPRALVLESALAAGGRDAKGLVLSWIVSIRDLVPPSWEPEKGERRPPRWEQEVLLKLASSLSALPFHLFASFSGRRWPGCLVDRLVVQA